MLALAKSKWHQEVADYLELEDGLPDSMVELIDDFYSKTEAALLDPDMAFECLLPDDEEADLLDQVECLAQWSKGFLDGFGASGAVQGKLNTDIEEVLRHFDAFSNASVDDESPENVTLYLELTEHARIAALTVFYAMNQVTHEKDTKALH